MKSQLGCAAMGVVGGEAEDGEAMARVRRKEMRGVQVEWVAAGLAVAAWVWVQDATGEIQLLAAVICMAMLALQC